VKLPTFEHWHFPITIVISTPLRKKAAYSYFQIFSFEWSQGCDARAISIALFYFALYAGTRHFARDPKSGVYAMIKIRHLYPDQNPTFVPCSKSGICALLKISYMLLSRRPPSPPGMPSATGNPRPF
jgi:hypothetical protein